MNKHRDSVWSLGPGLRRSIAWGFGGLVFLIAATALLFWHYIYGYAPIGLVGMALVAGIAAVVALALAWWPTRQPADRRLLRLPLAALAVLAGLWIIHLQPLQDAMARRAVAMAQQAAYEAATGENARDRLEALAPRNAYAAFLVFVADRTAATRSEVKALFKPVEALNIDWRFTLDPADHDAMNTLRSRLIDLDVLLSAVPDKVPALYRAEWQAVTVRSAEMGLAADFRQSMEATMRGRHADYATFYVTLAQLLRRAAEQYRAVLDAVAAGKATRGADGQLIYGDDATKAKVEPLLAALDGTRAQIGKLAEHAKALDQRYGGSVR